MKILIVSQYYFPERFSVTDIAENFVKQGNEVTVVTGKPNYGYQHILKEYKDKRFEIINGVRVYRINLSPRKETKASIINNYLSFHNNAKHFMRRFKEKFDVVLAFSLSPVISVSPALLYAKKNKVPCVLYCQDLWPEAPVAAGVVKKNSLIYSILLKWSKSIYNRCDRIIISSSSFKEYFVNELKIANKGFNLVNQPIIESNEKLDPIVFKNKHNFVYAGNIGSVQMIDKLVESLKFTKTNDLKLYLIGNGSQLKSIQKLIIDDGLSEKVECVGSLPISKTETYFANADALIVSLKNDGYVGKTIPNKVIQFLKYGRPILGIIGGDSKELLSKANGTVFCEENSKNIAENIDILCNMSQKEKDMRGLNNKEYFERNFRTEKLTQLLLNELIEVKK